MPDYEKGLLGNEDFAWDLNGNDSQYSRKDSTGGTKLVKKINARDMPLHQLLDFLDATSIHDALIYLKALWYDFEDLKNQNLNYKFFLGNFADLVALEAAHPSMSNGYYAFIEDDFYLYFWDNDLPGWRNMDRSAAEADAAAVSAAAALVSQTNSFNSETNAAISAAAALVSENNAATSESNASTSESNAATSESNASTSETNAASSETAAGVAKTAAEASAAEAAASALLSGHTHSNQAVLDATEESFTTTYKNQLDTLDAGVPVGTSLMWNSGAAPSGFVIENGAALNRTTYADLFAVIGVTAGNGDGSTTFNVPDKRGQFPRFNDSGAGIDPDAASRTDRGDGNGGDAVLTKQGDELGSHDHTFRGHSSSPLQGTGSSTFRAGVLDRQTDFTGGNETRPKNIYVNSIIKY